MTPVAGMFLHHMPVFSDARGTLSVGELGRTLPFEPRRYFLVYGVPGPHVRGEHAHRECHQFLVCVTGSLTVRGDDGRERAEVTLDAPNLGLHIPPGVWAVQSQFSADAVLLVLASHFYDPADYIRTHDEFVSWRARREP
jgi:UDP-2-acetamido-3-amino-2,3-dideoxy-glucuronate N-acetyltransferase